MTVTVGSDVYIDVAEADAHHAALGQPDWAAADLAAREAALLKATSYLDGRYRWVGLLADLGQPLGWPRIGAYDSEGRYLEGIPTRIGRACAELARVALTEDLSPAQDRGGRVVAEQVGGISVQYAQDAPAGRSFPKVDMLLKGLVRGESAIRVERA